MKTAISTLLGLLVLGTAPAVQKVDFAELSDFDYREGMTLPAAITALDGKEISVSGLMRAEDGDEAGEHEFFMLINNACDCEGIPELNEVIFCAMPVGETTTMRPGSVTLTGTLYVGEEIEEGVVVMLYTMDVDSIKVGH